MTDPQVMLSCRNLHKTFDVENVVDGVTLEVAAGDVLALLGPSGCGKTTTLRLIAGFERLSEGRIAIDGRVVADTASKLHVAPELRRVGMVFQDYAVFPHLSAGRNVGFALGRGKEARARVDELLDFVGLPGYYDKMPQELSGGEQQRVSLARALSTDPAVLLLDEPFSNLDAALRADVRLEVRSMLKQRGTTAVFVTHDQEEALFLGDRVAVMNRGRIEQSGAPEDIFHSPKTRFVAEFMGQTDFVNGESTDQGVMTPMGLIPYPTTLSPGSSVDVALRPDDLQLLEDDAGNGRLVSRLFNGMDYVYAIALTDGSLVHSRQPHTRRFREGATVLVSYSADHAPAYFAGGRAV